jgi:uncharacterized protein YggU (UPF0235/DUF167 family)
MAGGNKQGDGGGKQAFRVKVHPRAKKERVECIDSHTYEIWTTSAPEKGKANDAVRRLLAEAIGVAPSCLQLVRGTSSREKVFERTN